MNFDSWIVKLILATFLGSLIGLEREYHGRPAGLRTHILVCIGAAVLTISGLSIAAVFNNGNGSSGEEISRIVAGIVTGIGFLGAGAIIRTSDLIRGLTTAACIWFVAAIGIVIGIGQYFLAASSTAIALIVLVLLPLIENRVSALKYRDVIIRGESRDPLQLLDICTAVFERSRIGIHDVDVEIDNSGNFVNLLYHLRIRKIENKIELLNSLSEIDGVTTVTWQRSSGSSIDEISRSISPANGASN